VPAEEVRRAGLIAVVDLRREDEGTLREEDGGRREEVVMPEVDGIGVGSSKMLPEKERAGAIDGAGDGRGGGAKEGPGRSR
jgi:hypothetical protein